MINCDQTSFLPMILHNTLNHRAEQDATPVRILCGDVNNLSVFPVSTHKHLSDSEATSRTSYVE